ncbi:MAG: MerR family transcriptional regulator [Ignavibacteriaceae bacterium]|nr:MerR family transcriptional regulator [Ignavibacteriaceae bacterium]
MEAIKKNDTPLYAISVAARLLNISVHTLRMYEKEGLIVPFRKKTSHRLYSDSDIERLNCIRSAINESKISISGIKTLYAMIPCWEITNCSDMDRANCPAYDKSAHSQPCWMFAHENNICAVSECRKCKVYNGYAVCQSIKETIIDLTKRKTGDT